MKSADDAEQEDMGSTAEPVVEAPVYRAELRTRDAVDAYNAAIRWAKQAIVLAGLVSKQGKKQPDSEYKAYLEAEAKKLIAKVISVGSSISSGRAIPAKARGTFYTRPQLAVPTVHRTLEPLCYDRQPDGTLIPKTPEVILGLRLRPACGSASLWVASLHYLTEALYRSLCHHCELDDPAHAMKVTLPFGRPRSKPNDEIVPFPPNDTQRGRQAPARPGQGACFGDTLSSIASTAWTSIPSQLSLPVYRCGSRRSTRTAILIPRPQVKVGNGLVGCWDRPSLEYPLSAWEREGGDGKDGPRTDRIEHFSKGAGHPEWPPQRRWDHQQEMRQLDRAAVSGPGRSLRGSFRYCSGGRCRRTIEYELLHQIANI